MKAQTLSMNHGIGTPDSSGSFRHGSAPCRMNPAFLARIGSWSQSVRGSGWRLAMNLASVAASRQSAAISHKRSQRRSAETLLHRGSRQ